MIPPRPEHRYFIEILTKRSTFFLFFLMILIVYLYAIGNNQEFMDSTQLLLLRIVSVCSLLLSIVSLYGMVLGVLRFLRKGKQTRILVGVFVYLLCSIFAFIISAASVLLLVSTKGNIS